MSTVNPNDLSYWVFNTKIHCHSDEFKWINFKNMLRIKQQQNPMIVNTSESGNVIIFFKPKYPIQSEMDMSYDTTWNVFYEKYLSSSLL